MGKNEIYEEVEARNTLQVREQRLVSEDRLEEAISS